MVYLNKIYTRGGDKGHTSLGDGSRVSKSSLRIEVIGTIDESNAVLGCAVLHAPGDLQQNLRRIQNDLFDLGADLCIPENKTGKQALRIGVPHITWLETQIDEATSALQPLTSFILPGGSAFSCMLHWARTVVRRAERLACALNDQEPLNPKVVEYLNRLSDLLFVMARMANDGGRTDILWRPGETLSAQQES